MKKSMIAIMSTILLAGFVLAQADDNEAGEAKYYDNAKVIRIKNVDGEGFVQRSYEEGYEEATPNLPLFEKDTLGTSTGRLEVYLGRLNYLRLDSDTMIALEKIPQLRQTALNVRIEKGAVYLDVENLDNEKDIEVQTPDCGIFLLDKGVYRINVDENSQTEVYVIEGMAEVAGQDSSRSVRENQKIVMAQGEMKERPYYFYASEKDNFDRWNEAQSRELGYARYGTSRYLQSGYEDYEYEMSRAGRWTYMADYSSYVWTPYYSNAGWMPYANGRWIWNPHYGNVWTSYDHCGWFTHHYGRWHWSYAGGWYWIPSYHWSPAWVSWFGDNDYYGWCPLSWWNRPVIVINNHWDRHYNYRHGMPHHSRSTIIIRKSELTAANMQHVALKRSSLAPNANATLAYRGNAPTDRPAIAKVAVINANGKTMSYKQNAIVSSKKYRMDNAGAGVNSDGTAKATAYKDSSAAGTKAEFRTYKTRTDGSAPITATGKYYRSKSGDESSGTTRVRASSSSSSDKAQPRASSTSSKKTTSSSSGSGKAVKKKKDEAAYMALMQSENSAGYKSHARGQSDYAASSSDRYAYRSSAPATLGSKSYSYRAQGAESSRAYDSYRASAPETTNRFLKPRKISPANSPYSPSAYSSSSVFTSRGNRERGISAYGYGNYSNSGSGTRAYSGSYANRSYSTIGSSSSNFNTGSSARAVVSAPARSSYRVSATAPRSSSGSTATVKAKEKK